MYLHKSGLWDIHAERVSTGKLIVWPLFVAASELYTTSGVLHRRHINANHTTDKSGSTHAVCLESNSLIYGKELQDVAVKAMTDPGMG